MFDAYLFSQQQTEKVCIASQSRQNISTTLCVMQQKMRKYLNLSSIFIILMTFLSCQNKIDLNEVINQDLPFILTQWIQKVESEYPDFKIDTLKINSEKWKEFITFMTNNKDNWKSTLASYNSDFNITQNEFRLLGWKDGKSVVMSYKDKNGKIRQLTKEINNGEIDFLTNGE